MAFLQSMRIEGFRSFGPNSVHFNFYQDLNGVIGPSSSGKSNLIDAIKFGLGENDPANLRVEKFSDLIFKGIPRVPASKEARVTMNLCDLDMEGRTIIERVIDKHEYQSIKIDNKKSNLQELHELLRSLNLNLETFNVINGEMLFNSVHDLKKDTNAFFEKILPQKELRDAHENGELGQSIDQSFFEMINRVSFELQKIAKMIKILKISLFIKGENPRDYKVEIKG